MSTSTSNTTGFDRREPIPGYRTLDLLGRGGYGEVWRATAPGGIAKAVKIVYGEGDSTQANTEMRALTRVKDVRHPLLLSIERIEITHGNLVIVTELADGSLKQQFQKYSETQSTGIPQEELLQYISDSAEALDFLYERYSLQHLDVKPENILVVGGRAKVGDFGLVKNLYERSASIVGGLTPTYAPPELFEGRPTRHSDQYSLAIVYVQMLTGVLPFVASNMAQLATLHLKGVPDLTALPKRQRSVIARALSKDPAQRFESCTAMAVALKDAVRNPEPEPAPRRAAETPIERTLVRPPVIAKNDPDAALKREAASLMRPGSIPSTEATGDATISSFETTPASGVGDSVRSCHPTLLVGIGGAGVEVLSKLVRRLNDRYGRSEQWPPIEILLLDANAKTLTSQFHEDDLVRVHPIPIPLKPAESYGSNAADFVKWLGRRWFYNIPRDLSATSYRPLGRLALLANAQRVKTAISTVMGRAVAHADAAQSAGASPRKATPRVVVVGAMSGGTAGGAMIDVAYALRGELKRRGLSDDQVHGILLHATPRSSAERDRSRANAYSTLSELHHFSRPGSHYPGEPLLGTPPFHGDNATFGRTHLLHLGEGLGPTDWSLATDQIAEFVFGTTLSPAHRIFDANYSADDPSKKESSRAPTIHPYEVLSLGAGSGAIIDQAVRIACNDVIGLWRDGRSAQTAPENSVVIERTVKMNSFASQAGPRSRKVEDAVRRQLTDCRLDFASFQADAAEVLNLETGGDATQLISKLVEESLSATAKDFEGTDRAEAVVKMIDEFLQCESTGGVDESESNQLYSQLLGRLNVQTRMRIAPFLDWIRGLVDANDTRIEGARLYATTAQRILQSLQETAMIQAADLREKGQTIALEVRMADASRSERSRLSSWTFRKVDPDEGLRKALKNFTETRVNEILRRAVAKIIRIIDAELSTVVEQLDRLARDLSLLDEPVRGADDGRGDDDEPNGRSAAALLAYQQLILTQLGVRRPEIARRIEESIDAKLFRGGQGLRRFLAPESELRKNLSRPLSEAARQAVLECIRQISCQLIEVGSGDPARPDGNGLIPLLLRAIPTANESSTADIFHRVLIVPEEVDPAALRKRLAPTLPEAMIVRGGQCDVTLWSLGRPSTLTSVAEGIIGRVGVYRELAERLHTRIDIAWRPFVDQDELGNTAPQDAEPVSFATRTAVIPV